VEDGMALLHVDLQDGFASDAVTVAINGQVVFSRPDVQTKRLVGKAASFEAEVSDGHVELEINVPTKNLQQTIQLDISGTFYLGVSIEDGQIKHILSQKRFGYG
jgi:hypothetical protein